MSRLTQSQFIERCNNKHNFRYRYDKTVYRTIRDRVIVTCLTHGDFSVIADNHMRVSGCPKCGTLAGAKHTTITYDEFIEKIQEKNFDHLSFRREDYVNSRSPITVTCNIHNTTYKQKPYAIIKGHVGCKECLSEKLSTSTRNTTEEFRDNCKQIYGDSYDLSEVNYTKNTDYIKLNCKSHGEFIITPKYFLRGYHCKLCMKEDLIGKNSNSFYNEFKEKWPNYTINSEYKGLHVPISIICPEHGEFYKSPNQCRYSVDICDDCAIKSESSQERVVCAFLDSHNIQYTKHKKIKTDRSYIELDILLPEYDTAIEINGLYWHRERDNGRYSKDYHINKTKVCNKLGIRLLHFYDTEIDTKMNIVSNIILNKIGFNNSSTIHARKTSVSIITKKQKADFLNKNHLQGNDKSSVFIGLFSEEKLLSVMTFGNRKITGSTDHELMRYCVENNTRIVGGFSKMLNFYIKNFHPKKIKTYADRRYSDGKVYVSNGFTYLRASTPSYWYFGKDYKLYHRFTFAKHRQSNKLDIFDPNLTEYENMKNNKYSRIWDCGQLVFEYKLS